METLDLIQQQRQIAHKITAGLTQYRQAIANAAAWEREQAKTESARQQSRQDAEKEYDMACERAIEAMFGKPRTEKAQQATEKYIRGVLTKAKAANVTPARDLDSVQAVKSAMVALQSTKYLPTNVYRILSIIQIILIIVLPCSCVITAASVEEDSLLIALPVFIASVVIVLVFGRWGYNKKFSFHVSKFVRLKSLYMRWLELIDEQAQAEKASAQRTSQQEREKAGQALAAMVEQVKPALSQFTDLANSASPPWEDKVWRETTVGVGAAGIVRLGTFLLESELTL